MPNWLNYIHDNTSSIIFSHSIRSYSCKQFIKHICQRFHCIFYLFKCIGLCSCLNEHWFCTLMEAVSVCINIISAKKSRIICLPDKMHLKTHCQVVIPIWIIQIIYIPLNIAIAYSVKKHYFSHLPAVNKPCQCTMVTW